LHACARAGAEAQRRQDLQADEPAHHGLIFIIIIIIIIIIIKVVFSPPLSASLHGEHTL